MGRYFREFGIESPEIVEFAEQDDGTQTEELIIWETYGAILLPLAACGRLHDAQQVVWRAKGEQIPASWRFTISVTPR